MMPDRHELRVVHPLDGVWDFVLLGDVPVLEVDVTAVAYDDRMAVPAAFDAMPSYAGRRGCAAYRTVVTVTPGTPGRLHFGAVSFFARVVVDGVEVGTHSGGYSGFWVDVPSSAQRRRELVVLVDNRFDSVLSPLHEPYYDFYQYGGILRSVEWHEVPGAYLEAVEVRTVDEQTGEVSIVLTYGGERPEVADLLVQVDDGDRVAVRVPVQDGASVLTWFVPSPVPWSPHRPHLHRLTIQYGADDWNVRVGLRTVATAAGRVTINGEPVRLLGYCRHEAHPQFGPALPLAQVVADLQILRDLGCTFVRGSHYPQDQRFLDLCDELGLLVWEETLGWQQDDRHFASEAYAAAHGQALKEMVAASIHHPSVIMWGFLNEGRSDLESSRALYEESVASLRSLDPSRLVSYATNHVTEDLHLGLVDVISVNAYPGWYEDLTVTDPLQRIVPGLRGIAEFLDQQGYAGTPLLISEIGAEALWGWHDVLAGLWTEEFQAQYLDAVCTEVVGNERFAGVALWQLHDARTYQGSIALKRPRAFNNKGTLDEYRRPKLSYAVVRRHFRDAPGSQVPAAPA